MSVDRTVELPRGYVDQEGNHHREVTLRIPNVGDEIKAERALREKGYNPDVESAQKMALVCRCIESWGDIQDVRLHHVFSLRRPEAVMLIERLQQLESEAFDADLSEEDEGNSPGNGAPS